MKQCEICEVVLPEDYGNLLCDEHYKKLEEENARLKQMSEEDKKEMEVETVIVQDIEKPQNIERQCDESITDPSYQENLEKEDKPQWEANLVMFSKQHYILWHPTRDMYTHIKNWCMDTILKHPQYPKFIWKPKIVDVGCGIGVGSNILSQEADFVWGIDKNEKSVSFAKQCFERVKNGIYYSSQVAFDNMDFITDTREFMKFDVVVAIEIIEHINDYRTFLTNLITKFDNRSEHTPTEYFISTPNRNNKHIRKDKPYNSYHVREWTSEEFYNVLSKYFENISLMNTKGEPVERETIHTPLLAQCSKPRI